MERYAYRPGPLFATAPRRERRQQAADVGIPGSSDCLKDVIDMRPVYHRKLERVQAHIFVIQIVDIALRAISPAVNDPTTAISCVDRSVAF